MTADESAREQSDVSTSRPRIDDVLGAELERVALDAAVTAGQFVVSRRPQRLGFDTKSSDTDVVTEMDRRSEELIRGHLLSVRPQDAVHGEEGNDRAGTSGITWVVDPIDGTVNYLYGLPAYAVSVAAVVGDPRVTGAWEPVAGAVYNPVSGQVFHARTGGGAAVRYVGHTVSSDTPLTVGEGPSLDQCLLATGFAYESQVRARQADVLRAVLPVVRDIRRFGSAALDLCAVAAGTVDAYFEEGLNPWDLAAGWLVVTEAGGVVSGWLGRSPSFQGVVAAPAALHPQLLGLLESAIPR